MGLSVTIIVSPQPCNLSVIQFTQFFSQQSI
jgi:hypothetical protein